MILLIIKPTLNLFVVCLSGPVVCLFEPITLIDSESESATVWTVLIGLFLAHSDLWSKSSEGPPSV